MNEMPERIGPYILHAELGHGGMATVYRATDTLRNQVVALKVLPPELARNQILVRRFLREGQSSVKLRHPNVVHVFEAGRADGFYFIAMELAPGGTLGDRIRREGIIPNEEAADIIEQAARGLDYAHQLGYLHRDIKPSNIMFGEPDNRGRIRVMLTDFGIVKEMGSEQTNYTGTGQTVGTPVYMSPEQAQGYEMDQRADVYSLGVVAYNMLTGEVPFRSTSSLALLRMIVEDPLPPVTQRNPQVSQRVQSVLEQVLAKNPADRYAQAGGFAAALTEAINAPASKSVGRAGKTASGSAGGAASQDKGSARASAATGQGRSRTTIMLLSGVTVVLLVALVWILAGQGAGTGGVDNPPPPVVAASPDATPASVIAAATVQAGNEEEAGASAQATDAEPTEAPVVVLAATATPVSPPTATSTATPTPTPTATSTPTTTAVPTQTPLPTATPEPSPTAVATEAATPTKPKPTATPLQSTGPTATPTPIVLSGGATATPASGQSRPATSTPAATSTSVSTATPSHTPTRRATSTPARPTNTPVAEVMAEIAIARLNIRGGPGTNYAVVGTALQSEKYGVLGQRNNCEWLKIRFGTVSQAWVAGAAQFVTLTAPCSQIPAAAVPATPTRSAATATPRPRSTPTSAAGSNLACILFVNQLGAELNITFTRQSDGWNATFPVAKNGESEQCFAPGSYTYTLDAPPPWGSTNGTMDLSPGDRWRFPISGG